MTSLEQKKTAKEIEKIDREIAELNKSVWMRPANWFGVIAAVAAIGGLFTQNTINSIRNERIMLAAETDRTAAAALLAQAKADAQVALSQAEAARTEAQLAKDETSAAKEETALLEARTNELLEEAANLEAMVEKLEEQTIAAEARAREGDIRANAIKQQIERLQSELASLAQNPAPLPPATIQGLGNRLDGFARGLDCGPGTIFHCP